MYVIIGAAIVFGSLVLGYTMHGGKIAVLLQVSEFIIIGGAGLGSIVLAYSLKGCMQICTASLALLKGNPYGKPEYLELLQVLYELFGLAKREGPLALELHIEDPYKSDILQNYSFFLKNHHAVDLTADTLKLIVMGGISTYDLSDMMDIDLEAHHEETMKSVGMLNTIADAMPAFGIVAAVLGVVVTMQKIGGPPEEVGQSVAAALVGTFLGVLLGYGLFAPMARATEKISKSELQYLACVKHAIVAFARGDAALTCVEFARRSIEPEVRPTFSEVEESCKSRKSTEQASTPTAMAA